MEAWSLLILILTTILIGSNAQECGVAPLGSRVVGGEDAAAGSWPWMVSIHVNAHICGGTIIDVEWVLTAAHCIVVSTISSYTLYFGRDSQAGPNPNEVQRSLTQIIVHPDYNTTFLNNDIALMKLSSPITYTDYIRPVCLAGNSSQFHNATACWLTGWGRTADGVALPASSPLQEVQVPVIGNNQCACSYCVDPSVTITQNMICAGQENRGACQGDSGGPMQCKQNSKWIQSGIASFGIPCATRGFPEVYARVSQFQTWITEQVSGANISFVTFASNGTDPDATFVCRSSAESIKLATELTFLILSVKWMLHGFTV